MRRLSPRLLLCRLIRRRRFIEPLSKRIPFGDGAAASLFTTIWPKMSASRHYACLMMQGGKLALILMRAFITIIAMP